MLFLLFESCAKKSGKINAQNGKLKSGSRKKVTNPKQAIAKGLSEARESGEKVPKKSESKKSNAKKGSFKK